MMKYIVMECYPSYCILLDENGRFVKAANLNYEPGQIVEYPVLMKDTRSAGKRRRSGLAAGLAAKGQKSALTAELSEKRRKSALTAGLAALTACILLFFGIMGYQSSFVPYSTVLLSINPEIRMELNRRGQVLELTGLNNDGEQLVGDVEFKRKGKTEITEELVKRAVAMGFLSSGGYITFDINAPDDDLSSRYESEFRSAAEMTLKENGISAAIEFKHKDLHDQDDWDDDDWDDDGSGDWDQEDDSDDEWDDDRNRDDHGRDGDNPEGWNHDNDSDDWNQDDDTDEDWNQDDEGWNRNDIDRDNRDNNDNDDREDDDD